MKKIIFTVLTLSMSLFSFSQVPVEWPVAKSQLTSKLNSINTEIINRWDTVAYCTNFGGNLLLANSNKGYNLFTPDPVNYPFPIPAYQNAFYAKIDTMLMAFDSLGFKTVDVTIQYPLLVNGFPHKADYLDFFITVCNKIKQKGFKLTIGTQAAFVDTTFGEEYMVLDILDHYYNPDGNAFTDDTLENTRFRQEKLQMMQLVIDSLKPDYLIMEMEPQTQIANLFGLVDYSVDSTIAHINYFLPNLVPGTTLLGAGAGTWDDIDFFKEIALTNIDFIDFHVYPPHFDNLDDKAFIIDSIADANNKKLIIGEAWCYKATNSEMLSVVDPIGTSALVYSRDVFDYWIDVDTLFMRSMINLSQQSKIDVVSFFWVNNLFGQITWNNTIHGSMTPGQILTTGQQAGLAAMYQFNYTPQGDFIKNQIQIIDNNCNALGIYEFDKDKAPVYYPNPATNALYFSQQQKNIKIYNIQGTLIYQSLAETSEISVASFAPGIYIVSTENGFFKFIKQ